MLPRGVFNFYILFMIQLCVFFMLETTLDEKHLSFSHKFEISVLRQPFRLPSLSRNLLLIFFFQRTMEHALVMVILPSCAYLNFL